MKCIDPRHDDYQKEGCPRCVPPDHETFTAKIGTWLWAFAKAEAGEKRMQRKNVHGTWVTFDPTAAVEKERDHYKKALDAQVSHSVKAVDQREEYYTLQKEAHAELARAIARAEKAEAKATEEGRLASRWEGACLAAQKGLSNALERAEKAEAALNTSAKAIVEVQRWLDEARAEVERLTTDVEWWINSAEEIHAYAVRLYRAADAVWRDAGEDEIAAIIAALDAAPESVKRAAEER